MTFASTWTGPDEFTFDSSRTPRIAPREPTTGSRGLLAYGWSRTSGGGMASMTATVSSETVRTGP